MLLRDSFKYLSLPQALDRISKLRDMYKNSWGLSSEAGDNVRWYCAYKLHLYSKKYERYKRGEWLAERGYQIRQKYDIIRDTLVKVKDSISKNITPTQ